MLRSTASPSRHHASGLARPGALLTVALGGVILIAVEGGFREAPIGTGPIVAGLSTARPAAASVLARVAHAETPGASLPDAASATTPSIPSRPEMERWFNGRPVRPRRTLAMRVTAYSPDERSCAPFADGVTASGYSVWTNGMRLAAADTVVLPFGTLISVPGYDESSVIPVLDRGARIKGDRLDVLFPTHREARRWGVRDVTVTIWEYADGEPNDFRPRW